MVVGGTLPRTTMTAQTEPQECIIWVIITVLRSLIIARAVPEKPFRDCS